MILKYKKMVLVLGIACLSIVVFLKYGKKVEILDEYKTEKINAVYQLDYQQQGTYKLAQGILPHELATNADEQPIALEIKDNLLHLVIEKSVNKKSGQTHQFDVNGVLEVPTTKKKTAFYFAMNQELKFTKLQFDPSLTPAMKAILATLMLDLLAEKNEMQIQYPEGHLLVEARKIISKQNEMTQEQRMYKNVDPITKNEINTHIMGNGSFEYKKGHSLPQKLQITRTSQGEKSGEIIFTSQLNYSLNLNSSFKNVAVHKEESKGSNEYRDLTTMIQRSQDELIDRKLVANHVFEQDFQELLNLPDEINITKMTLLFTRIEAFLRLDPMLLAQVHQALENEDLSANKTDLLSVLLSANGSDQAQEYLRELTQKYLQDETKASIMVRSLAFIKDPNTQTQIFALGLRQGIASNLDLSEKLSFTLGSMAFHSKDEAFKQQVRSDIESQMTQSESSKIVGYIALGNMGYLPLVENAKALLQSSNDQERSFGIGLLRRVDQNNSLETKNLLFAHAESDKNHNIRRSAAEFIDESAMTNEDNQKLAELIKKESDITVVTAMVSTLGNNKSPHVKQLILNLYEQCGNPQLCKHMRAVLGGM